MSNAWDYFLIFALTSVALWWTGAWAAWRSRRTLALVTTALGIAVLATFVALLWIGLERPPLRTMGETRLWYSLLLPVAAGAVYVRWRYKWILGFGALLATVFVCVNIFKPQIHSSTLMPALQSPWFAPHVIVYMMAYALLGAAAVMAVYLLTRRTTIDRVEMEICDNLTGAGVAFMTVGMLMGALWAKEAWGHYWAWDPKETWAAITWMSYLVYIHYRHLPTSRHRISLAILIISFVLLQMCWWGINYLPAAQGTSVHTYNM